MAKVHANGMVGHLWANQSQDEARSSNGNLWFEGRTIYSYSTPIAHIVNGVYLVTACTYSQTTSGKHMPAVWRGIGYTSDRKSFRVPFVRPDNGDHGAHYANLCHLMKAYRDEVARLKRKVDRPESWARERVFGLANAAIDYAATFDVAGLHGINAREDLAEVEAEHDRKQAKRNTPQAIAKRAQAAAAKAKREAEAQRLRRAAISVKVEAWRGGATVDVSMGWSDPAMLRFNPRKQVVETSKGAFVPVEDCPRLWSLINAVRASGREWVRNGQTHRVGHFTVDRITPEGTAHIGCHRIEWPEFSAMAETLGYTSAATAA